MPNGLLIGGGMRLTFAIRDEAGLRANFRGYDRQLTTDARRSVRRNAARWLAIVRATVAYDTGRMQRLVKVKLTPSGLVFEGGWDAADFEREGEPFYPPFVELGTSRQAAQPSIEPAWLEVQGRLRLDIAADMRRSINRAG